MVNFNYLGSGQPIRINQAAITDLVTRPKIRGGFVRTTNATVAGVKAFYCTSGTIDDLLIAPNGSANGLTGIVLGGSAVLTVNNLTVDLSGYTGTQFRCFGFDAASTGNSLTVRSARVIGASGKFQTWFHGQSTSGSSAVLSRLQSDAAPTSFYLGAELLDSFQLSDGWALVSTWTYASDVAQVDFTDLAYDEVRVVARSVTKQTTGTLNVRVSTNNGSSYKTASGDYYSIAADGQETALTGVPMHDTNATLLRSGSAILSGLRGSSQKQARAENRNIFNTIETTSVVNALRVYPSGGGNITGGTITVFGR